MPISVLTSIAAARRWRADVERSTDGPGDVGLVPTMGFLHAGHLTLVRRAVAENSRAAATVFVNPTQFGASEDLASYPRDLERDIALLDEAGCHAVFAPSDDEMYPAGFQTWVEVGSVASPLEGARRPGHFRGVATIVAKLLCIFRPTRAYFGQKDAQQLAVIRTMVRDLNLPVQIVGCPTVREPDGLAMSSRNTYLTPKERRAATVLYRALTAAHEAWCAGETDAEALRCAMRTTLDAEPRAKTEYTSVADPLTMEELDQVQSSALLSMAVRIGRTRLIDNLLLDPAGAGEGRG